MKSKNTTVKYLAELLKNKRTFHFIGAEIINQFAKNFKVVCAVYQVFCKLVNLDAAAASTKMSMFSSGLEPVKYVSDQSITAEFKLVCEKYELRLFIHVFINVGYGPGLNHVYNNSCDLLISQFFQYFKNKIRKCKFCSVSLMEIKI